MASFDNAPSAPSERPRFCPKCGDPVRPDELYCDKCGTRLVSEAAAAAGPTLPPSPQASPPVPPAYAPPPAVKRGGPPLGLVLGCGGLVVLAVIFLCVVGIVGLGLFGGEETPTPMVGQPLTATTVPGKVAITPTPTSPAVALPQPLRNALLATVFIVSVDNTGKPVSSGSGTILTPQGHILTNFHVIGDPETGRYDNNQGLVYVGINPPDLNRKPDILYLAKVVKGDKSLDLALLRIVATKDGGKLPANLGLTSILVGDSDKVQIGDEISVIGFPGLGEDTVTFTKGTVSGFLDDPNSVGTWIKTDTEINPGNSGGAAINKAGELIGIPTQVRFDTRVTGKIGKIRPINFAKPLVQLAQRDAQEPVAFTFVPWSAAPTPVPSPKPGVARFGQVVICDDVVDGKPINPRATFPAGTKKVTAYWTFSGMVPGQEWGRQWLQDGEVIVDKLGQEWDDEPEGYTSYYLSDDEGLAPGNYEFRLYLGKTLVQKAAFTIQKPTAPMPTPSAGGFGKIIIAEDVTDDGETINPTNAFPAGAKVVWAYFTYFNMRPGQSWGRKWLRDGTVLKEATEKWDKGATGWRAYSWSNEDGLPSGTYQFILYLDGKEAQRATFTIGKPVAPTPTRAPARPALDVVLSNPHYERWGRPTAPDGCNGPYNNGSPVRRFTMELIVTNRSSQTVPSGWAPYFYANTGAALARCYFPYQEGAPVPAVPPGESRTVTFVTFTEETNWVGRVTVTLLGGTWSWTLDGAARIISGP